MSNIVLVSIYSLRWGPREELGIGYVASALENAGHWVEIVLVADDGASGLERLQETLGRLQPILVGIGCSHSTIGLIIYREISSIIKGAVPQTHLTCGGYFATFNAGELLCHWLELDSVVMGEGERTIIELVGILEQDSAIDECFGLKTRTNKFRPSPIVDDLDILPNPVRQIAGLPKSNLVPISTSRGCMAHCTFCNVPIWSRSYGGGWRGRSPERVVEEMAILYKERGARRFWMVDSSYEDPYPDGFQRIRAIADGILDRKLPISYYVFFRAESLVRTDCHALIEHLTASGLRRVFIGVESGNSMELKLFAKKAGIDEIRQALALLREHGIAVRVGFIMFTPQSTFENLRLNLRFLQEEGLLASTVDLTTRLELYSGATEVTRLQREGLLTGEPWNNPYAYRFIEPRIEPLAQRLSKLRPLNNAEHRWEAIHMARLVVAGAFLTPAVQEHKLLRRKAITLREELDELSEFLAQSNEQFFSSALKLAEAGWDDLKFDDLVKTYIDGCQVEVGKTCDMLVRLFLMEAQEVGVDVIY